MDNLLQTIVHVTVILTFLGGLFMFAVLRPLHKAIDELREVIQELKLDLRTGNERITRLECQVSELQASVKKSHDRIDVIKNKLP